MPPKGKRRGDDSDDDVAPAGKPSAPEPKGKAAKGGKKGRDDDEDELVSKVKGLKVVDDDDDGSKKKGGKKGKRKGDSDDEDAAPAPKGGAKKAAAKGGRRRDDDDDGDDGSDADVKPKGGKKGGAAARADDGSDDEDDRPGHKGGKAKSAPAPAPAKKGKKGKGKRGDDDSDDDEEEEAAAVTGLKPVPAKGGKAARKAMLDSDDEDDAPAGGAGKPAAGGKKGGKKPSAADDDDEDDAPKGGKGGKKGKKRRDDDDADFLPGLAAAAAAEAAPAAAPAEEEDAPAAKGGKGAKKGKKRRDEDDDADFLPGLAAAAAAAEAPVAAPPAPAPTAAAEADEDASPRKGKAGKKGKKGGFAEPEPEAEAEAAAEPAPAAAAVEAAAPAAPASAEPASAAAPAAEVAAAGEGEGDDFGKKKKKKKAAKKFEDEEEAAEAAAAAAADADEDGAGAGAGAGAGSSSAPAVGGAGAGSSKPAAAASAGDSPSGSGAFFGEATMGAASAVGEESDVPPEVAKILGKVAREGGPGGLSNKERRVYAAWMESEASKSSATAGYGTGGKVVSKDDEYGIKAFSVSQSAKLMAGDSAAAENSKDILIENFNITAHKKQLFKNAELRIAHGRRYGFVGPNGQGKTTLLKHIAARELAIPSRISVLYVEQEVIADDTPAVQAVLKADKKRASLLEEEKAILAALEKADAAEEAGSTSAEAGILSDAARGKMEDRLNAVYEELSAMRADASESQARRILAGLGFTADMMDAPTKHFSGGWRMRISLARALFMQPDLLLLDEPTNHLDLNAVIWLEDYLQKWKSTLFIVSHDQDFLSSVVTDIIHLEECKLWYYRGNYDDFKEMHAQKVMKQWKDWEKQQKTLKALKDKGATSKEAKDKAASRAKREIAGGSKKDKKAAAAAGGGMGRDDDDDGRREDELIIKPREYRVSFAFNDPDELPPPILSICRMSFRYGEKYPWLFKNVDLGIDQGSRVAIVGPNGVGKSTFLSLLIGDLEPSDGEVTRNRFLRVGKYSQHFVDVLPMGKTPVEFLQSLHTDLSYQAGRAVLGRFGLEGHAHTIPASELSGGQKARVVFANLSLSAPHIMVLDEPSNNLDAESIDALGDAIREFEGGIVLVSHDARLIRNAGCLLWVCNEQTVKPYDGDLDDYKASLLEAIHKDDAALEAMLEKQRAAEEAARLAAAKERQRKLRALREAKAAAAAGGAAAGGAGAAAAGGASEA